MDHVTIRPLLHTEHEQVQQFIQQQWGAEYVVVHGSIYYPHRLAGFVAVQATTWIGLITYTIVEQSCEIVTLDSIAGRRGVGTALLEAVRRRANALHCTRLWLVTTNDNLHALGFYQKRGFSLVAVHRNAVEQARQIKPTIPRISVDGIPIRDELELEDTTFPTITSPPRPVSPPKNW